MRLAISLFSGFLQRLGSPGSGLVDIENDLHHLVCHHCNVRVRLYPWKVNVSDIAESIWRYRPDNRPQRHIVAGYSYGGQTAVNFLHELELRGGIEIAQVILCDPVRRWKYLPGVAAALGIGTLTIPKIAENKVTCFVQRNPRWSLFRSGGIFQPAGHDLNIEADVVEKLSGHSYIDNDAHFRMKLKAAVVKELENEKATGSD